MALDIARCLAIMTGGPNDVAISEEKQSEVFGGLAILTPQGLRGNSMALIAY